jgi:hypothetical protein
MSTNEQVISSELAEQLSELNIYQNSEHYWIKKNGTFSLVEKKDAGQVTESFSAFDFFELLDILPSQVESEDTLFQLKISPTNQLCRINYETDPHSLNQTHELYSRLFFDDIIDTPANAMAKALIQLHQNGIIRINETGSVERCN